MGLVKDDNVTRIIERAAYHYHLNITNRVLRPYILQLYLDERTWSNIVNFTEKLELYRDKGFDLNELYKQLAACARFLETVRNGIHAIRGKVKDDRNASDKIYREMTVNNLPNNLKTFAELLNALYVILVDIDERSAENNIPIHINFPEFEKISRTLSSF